MKKKEVHVFSPFHSRVTEHWRALWGAGAKTPVEFDSLDATGTRCQQVVRWRLSEDDRRPMQEVFLQQDVEIKNKRKKIVLFRRLQQDEKKNTITSIPKNKIVDKKRKIFYFDSIEGKKKKINEK